MVPYHFTALVRDFENRLFVNGWVLGAHIAIDLFAVWVEIDVGWPSGDTVASCGLGISFPIDFDREQIRPDRIDQLWVSKGLLFKDFAGRAVVSIEMDQDWLTRGACESQGGFEVLRPWDPRLVSSGDAGKCKHSDKPCEDPELGASS